MFARIMSGKASFGSIIAGAIARGAAKTAAMRAAFKKRADPFDTAILRRVIRESSPQLAKTPAREREIMRKGRARMNSYRAAETGQWVENAYQSYPAATKRNGGLRGSTATRWR